MRLVRALFARGLAAVAWVVLALAALAVRGLFPPRKTRRPRLIYGPQPILNIKYMKEAMRQQGYTADTFVFDIYHIHSRDDFDYYLWDFFPRPLRKGPLGCWWNTFLGPYLVFLWLLARYDVFHSFFDGGFLRSTPLRFWEVHFLHWAGKRVVTTPYGSDCALTTHIRSLGFRQGLMANYPDLGRQQGKIARWLDHFARFSDFIVTAMVHLETLPRWDLLAMLYYPIDMEAWTSSVSPGDYNGKDGPVRVVHAPNHRYLKGTESLIQACHELQAEGYQLELQLLERLPNKEVKRAMGEADIIADQFIVGYALTALEGMSLARPVMSNLSADGYDVIHRLYNGMTECPIVGTGVNQIKETLRGLVSDPELRRTLGAAGRDYVRKYHSYQAMGQMWDAVYRKVWARESFELVAWHPDLRLPPSTWTD